MFALLFCGYPIVSFLPDFITLPDRAASIGFRALCLGLCLLLMAVGWARLKVQVWNLTLMLCFWTAYSARVIYDYLYVGLPGAMDFSDFTAYIYGISLATVLAMMAVRDLRRVRYAPLICVILCATTCILSMIYGVANFQVELTNRLSANDRLNPITLGHTATTLIVCALWYLLRPKGQKVSDETDELDLQQSGFMYLVGRLSSLARVPVMLAAVIIGLYTLGLSASRAPAIALACCLVLFVIWLRGRLVYLAVLTVAVLLTFIQLGFLSQILDLGVNLERVSSYGMLDEDLNLSGGRMDLYLEAWNKFTGSPFFGDSLFLENMLYPHNLILETLMATGLGGGVLLLLILGKALRNYLEQVRSSPIAFWLLLLFTQAFVGAMLSGSIFYDPMMWTTLSLGFGLAHFSRPEAARRRPVEVGSSRSFVGVR
ncbi:MAG: O-antigen ligase family protein [Lacunisphaera sp.]|nr:O-antigen ligase family protein [Lacunisphaera sp.]